MGVDIQFCFLNLLSSLPQRRAHFLPLENSSSLPMSSVPMRPPGPVCCPSLACSLALMISTYGGQETQLVLIGVIHEVKCADSISHSPFPSCWMLSWQEVSLEPPPVVSLSSLLPTGQSFLKKEWDQHKERSRDGKLKKRSCWWTLSLWFHSCALQLDKPKQSPLMA